ncbi:hypothetical protein N0V88_006284 [Collariella sp. IMI 366227]|nr:hypothetical protein N0V88_006284 [Collariella sp. IMI 366227]
MPSHVKDKQGEPIHKGDHVFVRSRGGRHESEVDKIVTKKEDAEKEDVKHPPKHNPGTAQHGEYKKS